jgi:cytoskeletal protein CcmA (bactofilin family)
MKTIFSLITRFVERLGPKLVLAMALLVALTLLAGIYLGRQSAYKTMKAVPQVMEGTQAELSAAREALKVMQGDLQIQRTRHEVDSRALELLRGEMAAEKERTADLEEGLRFYRSMVVSEDIASGLSLSKPELVSSEAPGRVAYRIFIQQKERDYEMVEGTLSVEVFGLKGEAEVSHSLAALSEDFDRQAAALHFRYFQAVEGELVLPEGFEPKGMTVVASSFPGSYRSDLSMLGSKKTASVPGGTTLISHDTVVIGDVHFSGNLDVEGLVQGNIIAQAGKDAQLRVVGKGRVEGDIRVPCVIINGAVQGNVYSSKHLELASKSRVQGNVFYTLVEMAAGAEVNGGLTHMAEADAITETAGTGAATSETREKWGLKMDSATKDLVTKVD